MFSARKGNSTDSSSVQALYTCLMKHFATWLQLVLFTQQFSGSQAICVLVEINGTLEQVIKCVVAWEWRSSQMTKSVNTSVGGRTVALSGWLTLSHNQQKQLAQCTLQSCFRSAVCVISTTKATKIYLPITEIHALRASYFMPNQFLSMIKHAH